MCSCFSHVCSPMRSNTMHIAAMRIHKKTTITKTTTTPRLLEYELLIHYSAVNILPHDIHPLIRWSFLLWYNLSHSYFWNKDSQCNWLVLYYLIDITSLFDHLLSQQLMRKWNYVQLCTPMYVAPCGAIPCILRQCAEKDDHNEDDYYKDEHTKISRTHC